MCICGYVCREGNISGVAKRQGARCKKYMYHTYCLLHWILPWCKNISRRLSPFSTQLNIICLYMYVHMQTIIYFVTRCIFILDVMLRLKEKINRNMFNYLLRIFSFLLFFYFYCFLFFFFFYVKNIDLERMRVCVEAREIE